MEIQWSGNVRIARCGADKFGRLDTRFCGETFQFREALIPGGYGKFVETICPVCSLKWDIMAASTFDMRYKFCEELAALLSIDPYSAYKLAERSFHFKHVHVRPVEPPQRPIPQQTVIPQTRYPYADQ